MDQTKFIIFIVVFVILAVLSWTSLIRPKSHGFYRLLAWIFISILILLNIDHWFTKPFSLNQIVSWMLLITSLYLLYESVKLLSRKGKASESRNDNQLYKFEKTIELITTGLYKYIRHPMYSSLLFLTWGVCLKNLSTVSIALAIISTICLYVTARIEEKENINYFGKNYNEYMGTSKRFIPFIF